MRYSENVNREPTKDAVILNYVFGGVLVMLLGVAVWAFHSLFSAIRKKFMI